MLNRFFKYLCFACFLIINTSCNNHHQATTYKEELTQFEKKDLIFGFNDAYRCYASISKPNVSNNNITFTFEVEVEEKDGLPTYSLLFLLDANLKICSYFANYNYSNSYYVKNNLITYSILIENQKYDSLLYLEYTLNSIYHLFFYFKK